MGTLLYHPRVKLEIPPSCLVHPNVIITTYISTLTSICFRIATFEKERRNNGEIG